MKSMNGHHHKAKLSKFALGIGFGIAEGLMLLGLAWAGWLGGMGLTLVKHMAEFMNGYGPSFMGGMVGGAWGFVDGFIFGFIAAFIYNLCLCCCKKSSCCDGTEKKCE